MKTLLNLSFSDPRVAIVNIVIITFLAIGIYTGYKKGFLDSTIRFVGTIVAIVGAYALKNPISVLLYTHLPFFKLGGAFKGVTVLNILIYELIAFIIVYSLLMLVIKLICKITNLVDKVLSFVFLLGIPNKILGAIIGFAESYIFLYFFIFIFAFCCQLFGFGMKPSLADDVLVTPVLKETFAPAYNSLEEISELKTEYENSENKEEYNYKALDILLKYKVITKENAEILINNGKIQISNSEDLLKNY